MYRPQSGRFGEGPQRGPADDYVELTLVNPATNTLVYNIDFHASTGALGGGSLTYVKPGEQVKLRFKATKPGVYIYHCALGGIMGLCCKVLPEW